MRQVLLIIDVQPSFNPPEWLVNGINTLLGHMPSVATVERHDESQTPFARQLGRQPDADDDSLIAAERVPVCGLQTDTCVLAAGFALFDVGLQPTLITDLTPGSSPDRSGPLGVQLWRHHFRHLTPCAKLVTHRPSARNAQ